MSCCLIISVKVAEKHTEDLKDHAYSDFQMLWILTQDRH